MAQDLLKENKIRLNNEVQEEFYKLCTLPLNSHTWVSLVADGLPHVVVEWF